MFKCPRCVGDNTLYTNEKLYVEHLRIYHPVLLRKFGVEWFLRVGEVKGGEKE